MKFKLLLFTCLIVSGTLVAQNDTEPADKIMNEAYKQAAKEGKNVMVVFHASWCGWCRRFDASLRDPSCKEFFDKNFVIVHLDIMEQKDKKNIENPGAEALFNKYGGAGGGIPYFLIFDKKGNLLADSKFKDPGDKSDKPAQNMGCPASDEEVAAFISLLKKTSGINDQEAVAITARFIKNR